MAAEGELSELEQELNARRESAKAIKLIAAGKFAQIANLHRLWDRTLFDLLDKGAELASRFGTDYQFNPFD